MEEIVMRSPLDPIDPDTVSLQKLARILTHIIIYGGLILTVLAIGSLHLRCQVDDLKTTVHQNTIQTICNQTRLDRADAPRCASTEEEP